MARYSFNILALSAIVGLSFLFLSLRQIQPHFNTPSKSPETSQLYEDGIPNQVHFVYLVKDSSANISLQFSHYLAVYAAWHHWNPHTIFLHTNANADSIARARAGESSKWDQRIFEMPGFVVNHVSVPTRANNGMELRYAEHASDFVRVKAVRDLGGVYIDFDAFALRDIKPLRQSGFSAIAGREVTDQINSGIFMSKQNGTVITRWAEDMHKVYDGNWVTHSNIALTRIAEESVALPGEMLIMERNALAPGGWGPPEYNSLWEAHDDVPSNLEHVNQGDPLPPHSDTGPSWVTQWTRTYILHAFMPYRANYKVKGFDYISPRYVLERRSNFARALYPVVRLMYERGLVTIDDPFHGYSSPPNQSVPNMPVPFTPVAPKPAPDASQSSSSAEPPASSSPSASSSSVGSASASTPSSQNASITSSTDQATPTPPIPVKPVPEQPVLSHNVHSV